MPVLLHLDSSADLQRSTSRGLTSHFAEEWSAQGRGHTVVRRDLHVDALPHLPSSALHWPPRLRTTEESVDPAAEALQTELIDEVIAADVVVVGAPMYNWSMPSTLKAWIDYLHVPGVTTPFDGPTKPLEGTPIVVVSSRGNTYADGTPGAGTDFVVPTLQHVFGTVFGMDVHVVLAEWTLAGRVPAMAPLIGDARQSLSAARDQVSELATTLSARG
ncbi:FMN-dependent NADH-azoreductase [Rhodococcoides trifolii]|uniref:FMN dependent NADH:quinone oxidoreductase n=1 Tax=Rhodococcoides trifolii TaxID=908250 RepID=A0A917FQR2_9NOCA|nr:NAD(P)H-dependent oxidoreductase [Rhodococcus trifolii]GGG00271.1 FMN-dependent NADH-azoreductase [Rhodococcus trifolii]